MRVQEIANRAFPRNIKERLRRVKKQLISTVPEGFVKCIEEKEEIKFLSGMGKRLTMEDITGIAEKLDRKFRKDQIIENTTFSETNELKHRTTVHRTENVPEKISTCRGALNGRHMMERSSPPLQCQYCGRRGHVEAHCWLRLGACTICGNQSHKYMQCPNYFTAKCSLCSGPHLGKECSMKQT
jgi:hypothetical protein